MENVIYIIGEEGEFNFVFVNVMKNRNIFTYNGNNSILNVVVYNGGSFDK